MSKAIREQQQPRMQPFYWIATFEMYSLFFLFGLALAAGPFVVMNQWNNKWLWLLLVLVPFGLWVMFYSFISLRERTWQNRHRDQFRLYEDRLEYIRWDTRTKTSKEGTLPLSWINDVVYGRYSALYQYAYRKTGFREQVGLSELAPVLYIRYHDGFRQSVLPIPFITDIEVNQWLEKLLPRGLQLSLTSIAPDELFDEERLQSYLDENIDMKQVEFSGHIARDFQEYLDELIRAVKDKIYGVDPEDAAEAHEPGEEVYQGALGTPMQWDSSSRYAGAAAWSMLIMQWVCAWAFIWLAERGNLQPDSVVVPVLTMLMTSVWFFLLARSLTWKRMLTFSMASFFNVVIAAVTLSSGIEQSPSDVAATHMTMGGMFFPLFVWIPYLIVRRIRRRREERQNSSSEWSRHEQA